MSAAPITMPRAPEILTEVDVSAGTVHLTVTPAVAAQLAEVWWHAHTSGLIVGRDEHTALSQTLELAKAAGAAAEEVGLLTPPPFAPVDLPALQLIDTSPGLTRWRCRLCGADFGAAGTSDPTGEAEEYLQVEKRRHETRACLGSRPVPAAGGGRP